MASEAGMSLEWFGWVHEGPYMADEIPRKVPSKLHVRSRIGIVRLTQKLAMLTLMGMLR